MTSLTPDKQEQYDNLINFQILSKKPTNQTKTNANEKNLKDNWAVCNADSLKIFLGKTHPYEKLQKGKKGVAQLLYFKILFKGSQHIKDTYQSQASSLKPHKCTCLSTLSSLSVSALKYQLDQKQ
jgi:hypothetical protein